MLIPLDILHAVCSTHNVFKSLIGILKYLNFRKLSNKVLELNYNCLICYAKNMWYVLRDLDLKMFILIFCFHVAPSHSHKAPSYQD